MDPDAEIFFEFVPVIRQYKSGRVERLMAPNTVPASVDTATAVTSKDITIDSATGLKARLYLPDLATCARKKLPIVIYFHGGGLVVGSASDAPEHCFLNRLVARARVMAVSVDYRLAPEHLVPAAYHDAWTALRWVASTDAANDPWLREYGDRGSIFVLGFSAGGNIAHNTALRAGAEEVARGVGIKGLALVHPLFLSSRKTDAEVKNAAVRAKLEDLWVFACGGRTTGLDDPRINPVADGAPSLRGLGCQGILVCTANDELEKRGKMYHEGLLESGWPPEDAELLESEGEEHQFFLEKPDCEKALTMMDRLVAFFNRNR